MLRNDDIVPRLSAGAGDGVTKMCAMQVVSWQNGDTKITDFPACSARPLARLVQQVNDRLAGPDGFLSPEGSVLVLDLGWRTVGTADTPRAVVWRWLADLLIDPEMGVVKYARPDGVAAIQRVAELCIRESLGEAVSADEWAAARAEARKARAAAYAAAADAAAYAAADAAAYAAAYAAYAYADVAAYAAASAAYADAYADVAAYAAASAAYADADALIRFTTWAIEHWRELAGLDTPPVDHAAVDAALARINA